MEIISKLIKTAEAEIGTKESPSGSNKVKYNTAYYGRAVSGSAYPWCCAFIWWLFRECNVSHLFYDGKKTASCTTLMNYYKKKGQTSNIPKVGSLAFFNWGKGTKAQHIGIVKKVNSDGSFNTIEGNTAVGNDSNGGAVMERKRFKNQTITFAYPYTGGEKKVTVTLPVLKKGSKGESVRALQILLNGYGYNCGIADGDFGTKTENALRIFQRDNELTADAIAGAKTWDAILT